MLKVSASDIKFGVSNLAIDPVVLKVSASDIKFGVSNLIIPTILVGTSVAPPSPSPTKKTYTPSLLSSNTVLYGTINALIVGSANLGSSNFSLYSYLLAQNSTTIKVVFDAANIPSYINFYAGQSNVGIGGTFSGGFGIGDVSVYSDEALTNLLGTFVIPNSNKTLNTLTLSGSTSYPFLVFVCTSSRYSVSIGITGLDVFGI